MQRKAAAKAQSAGKQKWVPKGAEGEKEEGESESPTSSPILMAKSEGPCFDKMALLKVFEAVSEAATKHGQEDDDDLHVDVSLSERPATDAEKTPGARRAIREAKKAEKAGNYGEELDTSFMESAWSSDMHPAQAEAYASMNAAMMEYLQSMAYGFGPVAMGPPGPGGYTTVMLRNIPNRYSRDMLTERLNETYKGQYDFVYLPIDFNSKCNVGYAFINFRNSSTASVFTQEFHGKRTKHVLPGFSSAKVCEVSYARVQGRDANMENLRDEKFVEKLNEKPEWQPLFFDEEGEAIPFSKTLGAGNGGKKKGARKDVAGPPGGWTGYGPYSPMPFMWPQWTSQGTALAATTTTLSDVLPSATSETMLMFKEIPTTLNQEEMIKHLDKSYKGAYDFMYLPKDTKSEGNRGFVFVNFKTTEKAEAFTKEFNGVKASEAFPGAEIEAALEVANARLHSLEGSIAKAQSSKLKGAGEKGLWAPVLFSPDGDQLPFPSLAPPPAGGKGKSAAAAEEEPGDNKKGKKGEGKGKKGKGAGAWGYPGYNNPAAYMANVMAMHQVAMVQAMSAHTAAQAAAAKFAHKQTNGAPSTGAGKTDKLSEEKKEALKKQLEFYFSTDNLCKDVYLRQHMDVATGYAALDLIAQFPQVKKFKASNDDIAEVLGASQVLELDSTQTMMRIKDGTERKRWATPDEKAPAAA